MERIEPCDLNAVDARRLIGSRDLSPVELLESCIKRIGDVNPFVNAVVSKCYDRARLEAQKAEKSIPKDHKLLPLHGLPIGIKDLNDTAGLRTTYGSMLYKDYIPKKDEALVVRLRKAGAIVFVKTNTPEFGCGSNTDNKIFGVTRNPFDLKITPGGSSGGSAVAVATGMLPLAHGSDTFGSLRNPATWCGIVGFRPTPGMVSCEKRVLNYSHFSVQGPMARTVEDVSLMMCGLVGSDFRDPMSGYFNACDFSNLRQLALSGLKVGWTMDFAGIAPVDKNIRKTFSTIVSGLSNVFASLENHELKFQGIRDSLWTLRCLYYLANHEERVRLYENSLSSNVILNVKAGLKMGLLDAAKAERIWSQVYSSFQNLFKKIDLLIAPGNATSPFLIEDGIPHEVDGQPLRNYVDASLIRSIITLSGHPVIAIPCGRDHLGLPFGIQVVGRRHGDKALLEAAVKMQRHFQLELKTKQPKPNIEDILKW